uniref:Interleukin 11a n=1 Tax=Sphaeramia orbicularis TaxID=375764 RepID=A0A673AYG2_9TELE
ELFVQSSSRPTHNVSMCGMLGSMIPQLDTLLNLSKKLHGLVRFNCHQKRKRTERQNKLDNLPNIQHTAAAFSSSKMNQTLSQLYEFAQSFQFHLNWLKIARDNVSLPCQPAEGASAQMLQLSDVLKASLLQISLDVPHTPLPSFPVVSTAFEALQFSVEISEHLQVFCHWAKRSIRHLQRQQRCPRQ